MLSLGNRQLTKLKLYHISFNLQGEFKTKNTNPITLGHEFSGKIVAIGDLAKDKFKIGDKVAVDPNRCKLKIYFHSSIKELPHLIY